MDEMLINFYCFHGVKIYYTIKKPKPEILEGYQRLDWQLKFV